GSRAAISMYGWSRAPWARRQYLSRASAGSTSARPIPKAARSSTACGFSRRRRVIIAPRSTATLAKANAHRRGKSSSRRVDKVSNRDCRLRGLVDDLAHAGRWWRLHDRLGGGLALAGLLLRRCLRRCSGLRHDELNAYGAARHECYFQFRRENKPAALNDVRPASAKSDVAAKGFIDRAGAVQAWSAKFQALSAKGWIISALPGANSLVAVPSRTRPMMP